VRVERIETARGRVDLVPVEPETDPGSRRPTPSQANQPRNRG
jgi:hypothetical protein